MSCLNANRYPREVRLRRRPREVRPRRTFTSPQNHEFGSFGLADFGHFGLAWLGCGLGIGLGPSTSEASSRAFHMML